MKRLWFSCQDRASVQQGETKGFVEVLRLLPIREAGVWVRCLRMGPFHPSERQSRGDAASSVFLGRAGHLSTSLVTIEL